MLDSSGLNEISIADIVEFVGISGDFDPELVNMARSGRDAPTLKPWHKCQQPAQQKALASEAYSDDSEGASEAYSRMLAVDDAYSAQQAVANNQIEC